MTKEQVESYCGDILTFIKKTINLGGYIYGVFDEAKILCDSGADYKFLTNYLSMDMTMRNRNLT